VLLVSHDRSFLDNVVTQTIAAEGDGHWQEYVGGYAEWEAQRPRPEPAAADVARAAQADSGKIASGSDAAAGAADPASQPNRARKNRLAPWEAEELAGLPDRIAGLEAKQADLAAKLSAPDLYREGPAEAERIQQALNGLGEQLDALFERWTILEDKRGD
jgi:ATP-binding cassette subfamily F protein uup